MKSQGFRVLLLILVGATFLLAAGQSGKAGDWPCWRGPTGLGFTDEKDLPLTWNGKTGENILWKSPLHNEGPKPRLEFSSPGWSCPIVWKDRVFVTIALWPIGVEEKVRRMTIPSHHLLCFQVSDGKQLWDTPVPAGKCVVDNFYHGYAVPTPVTDGEHVFVVFGSGVIASLDFDGKIVWREEFPRLKDVDSGLCSSPILYQDTIIVPGIDNAGLRALEKKTGRVKWEQQTKSRNKMPTPLLATIGGKTQLIHYAGGIQGLDPTTGELLWTCRAPSTSYSSPAFGAGLLYADAGRGGQKGTAVDPTGKGDVTKTHVKWEIKVNGAAGSSPVIIGDYLYRVSDPGFFRCWKADSGELVYEERLQKITSCASPVVTADGRIYLGGATRCYVIKAGPRFELLATNDLNDGADYTTPAVSNGRIFIKGRNYLWCIGKP